MQSIILHIDFNSFFASVEQQANPFLRGKPIAIIGKQGKKDLKRSIVATASIEAKKQGIKTAMPVWQAKKHCPELILLSGDMRKYSEITKRLINVLKKHTDHVEQFSTDEAFATITLSAQDYFGTAFIGQIIRHDIANICGKYCRVSIGIAPNKLLAKLASNAQKPNGMTIIQPSQVQAFLTSQPLHCICGIGQAMQKKLELLGITSFRALQQASKELLIREFKQQRGTWLFELGKGHADLLKKTQGQKAKSISHSYTFNHDLEFQTEIQTNILALCDKVAYRLRKNNLSARTLSILLRYSDFSHSHKQSHIPVPVQDGLIMYKHLWSIVQRIRDTSKTIRLIGISASQLINSPGTKPLFQKAQKMQKTLQAQDCIAVKFGKNSLIRAATMHAEFQKRASGWHYDHEL